MFPYQKRLLLSPPSPYLLSLIQQCSVTSGSRVQAGEIIIPCDLRKSFFLESIAALNSFWQLHFHPVYFLFSGANVLGQSWMSRVFGQRGHHPQLGCAPDHVRNCSPLQDKVSWPNLSHIPLQSKQSQCLCSEINHNLWNGPLFASSVWAIIPEEKIGFGNFWTEEFIS